MAGYLGNAPTAVPLTSADITDGIITNADISSTAGITLNKLSGNPNFRNIIINGDMQIAQRNTSKSFSSGSDYHTVDRFRTIIDSLGTWTQSQSTDVPTGQGFASSLKMDCTTADASPSASDVLLIRQIFEAQNLQYLKKGTANAQSLTLSFWVKSTKTGTFIAELFDDNSRGISKSYTVNASNTWEKKTLTFEGDTSGTIANTNGFGMVLNFWLGAGSNLTSGTLNTSWSVVADANRVVGQVNIADSTANDFYLTGVQLEAGTSATDFEFLPIDVSLARCQRYYELIFLSEQVSCGQAFQHSAVMADIQYLTQKRANPTITLPAVGTGAGQINFLNSSMNYPATTGTIIADNITVTRFRVNGTGFTSSFTAGDASYLYSNSTSQIKIDSEL